MPTANPLEQLRRRMLSHASPAAFAAVAEEHRRAGRLAEAIAVCRDGLERYPAYASARVTLGRALLDSGDVAAAVAELEQAVAQAPDNLAATRALDAARAEAPTVPHPAAPAAPADLPLHASGLPGDNTGDLAAPLLPSPPSAAAPGPDAACTDAPASDPLDVGVDGPQEFGLGPDWLPPWPTDESRAAAPPPLPGEGAVTAPPAEYGMVSFDEPSFEQPPHGDDPASLWPVPDLDAIHAGAPAEGAAFSWTLEAHDGTEAPGAAACEAGSVWAAPTLEGPLVGLGQVEASSDVEASSEADAPLGTGAASEMEVFDGSADPGGHADWSGLFAEPVSDGAAPRSFSGWESSEPTTPEPPGWAATPDEPGVVSALAASEFWGTPSAASQPDGVADRPAAALSASQPALPAASTVPESATASVVDDSAATPEAMGEWTMRAVPPIGVPDAACACADDVAVDAAVEPAAIDNAAQTAEAVEPAASDNAAHTADAGDAGGAPGAGEEPAEGHQLWARALTSALDEVFARAGHVSPDDGVPQESPASPNRAVGGAVTDVAPAVTLEGATQYGGALPPAVGSLQQMLDAVRARRAALHAEMNH